MVYQNWQIRDMKERPLLCLGCHLSHFKVELKNLALHYLSFLIDMGIDRMGDIWFLAIKAFFTLLWNLHCVYFGTTSWSRICLYSSIGTFPRRVGWIRVLFGKVTLFIKPWNLFFVQRAFFKGVCAEKLDLHGEWWWSNIPLIKDYSEIIHQLKITGLELTSNNIPLRFFALINVANNPIQLTKSSTGEVIPIPTILILLATQVLK